MKWTYPDTFIFDLDGTIIDSAPVIALVLNDMRIELDLKPQMVDFYRALISQGVTYLITQSLEVAINDVKRFTEEFRQRYLKLPTTKNATYPDVLNTINHLFRTGKKLAICSNKPENLCRKIIIDLGLSDVFKVIVGGDTLPSCKPSRETLDYVVSQLGVSLSSSILIGDSTVDQQTAASAGIPFVFFSGGYDDGVNKSQASYVISNLIELLDANLFENDSRHMH